jgi:hypothetical protein
LSHHHTWTVEAPVDVADHDVDFRLIDPRGRHMGVRFTTFEETFVTVPEEAELWTSIPPGHYFSLDCQAIRNGRPYGYNPPVKRFRSAREREIAIGRYAEDARYRATKIGKLPSGESAVAPAARAARTLQKSEAAKKREEKAERKTIRDAKVATEIPLVEAEVQALLNDDGLMEYLKSHPWPLVIPGPPSMAYTAHDHVVGKGVRYVSYEEHEGTPDRHLSQLKWLLRLLKEQARLRARGLTPTTSMGK